MSNPKSTICPTCDGTGKVFLEPTEQEGWDWCLKCHGSGSIPAVQPDSSDSQRHETLESNSIEFDNIESDHLRDAKEVITTPSKAESRDSVTSETPKPNVLGNVSGKRTNFVQTITPRKGCRQCRGRGEYAVEVTTTEGEPKTIHCLCPHSEDYEALPSLNGSPSAESDDAKFKAESGYDCPVKGCYHQFHSQRTLDNHLANKHAAKPTPPQSEIERGEIEARIDELDRLLEGNKWFTENGYYCFSCNTLTHPDSYRSQESGLLGIPYVCSNCDSAGVVHSSHASREQIKRRVAELTASLGEETKS